MIAIEIQLSETDASRAFWLHQRPKPWLRVLGLLLVLGFGWVLVYSAMEIIRTGRWVESAALWLLLPCLAFSLYWQDHRLRLNFRELNAGRPLQLAFSPDGISVKTETGEGTDSWDVFRRWRLGGRRLLIYVSSDVYIQIPFDQIAPKEANEIRALLTEKLGPAS